MIHAKLIFALMLALLMPVAALAETGGAETGEAAAGDRPAPVLPVDATGLSGVSDWAAGTNEYMDLRLLSPVTGTGQLESLTIGIEVRMPAKWHTYWRTPGDAGLPLHIDLAGSTGVKSLRQIDWPAPTRHELYGFFTHVYYTDRIIPVQLELEAPGAAVHLAPVIDIQVCDDMCFPLKATPVLDIPAGEAKLSDAALALDKARGGLPAAPEIGGLKVTRMDKTETGFALDLQSDQPLGDKPAIFVEHAEKYISMGWPLWSFAEDRLSATATWPYASGKPPRAFDPAGQPVILTITDGLRAVEQPFTIGGRAAGLAALPRGGEGDGLAAVSLGFAGWASMLALAVLGGLILNLMPCVLPVLSLKMFSVVKSAGKERAAIRAGFLATAAGIFVSFMILAAALAGLKLSGQAVGWGIQFQQPLFIVFLLIVVLGFAANLFGWFEIILPAALGGRITQAGQSTHPLAGSFVTGMFATLLATPCSAPFLGTAVGFALAGPVGYIFAIFAALALGLALPYLLVALFPGLATRMPKPGAWMVKLRAVLGLMLIATAGWLIFVLAGTAGLLAAGAVTLLGIIAMAVLSRYTHLAETRRASVRLGLVGLIALALITPGMLQAEASPAGTQMQESGWITFNHNRIAEDVAAGKVVFVDITADWCLTCQVNKKLVMTADPVATALQADNITPMRGDWTRRGDDIQHFLASHGRYGIPFNIVYGPAAPDGIVLGEVLTADAVLEAIDKAGG